MNKRQKTSQSGKRFNEDVVANNSHLAKKKATATADVNVNDPSSYSSKKYWDDRYREKNIEHEWYYSFDILEPILIEARKFTRHDKVLELGCGDRPLIQDFKKFNVQSSSLFAIDFSESVIADLKCVETYAGIHFESMDARNLSFADETFSFIIEKGTIDAMLSAKKQSEGLKNAFKLVEQAIRTLTKDGVFVIISHIRVDSDEFELFMDDVIIPGLENKSGVHWDITVHSVKEQGEENENGELEAKFGTVYVITAKPRKSTRGVGTTKGTISFQVKEYSDDEEGENLCMPCSR